MGARVVVIGGGNVALDVARTAARGGDEENLRAQPLRRPGPRRRAQRRPLRRARGDRLLPRVGERDARREGGGRGSPPRGHPLPLPRSGRSGSSGRTARVTGVEFLDVSRVFDETGRFSPRVRGGLGDASSRPTRSSSRSDRPGTSPSSARRTGSRRAEGGSRSIRKRSRRRAPGVYAGGDAAFGPRIAINAVADGKRGGPFDRRASSGAGRARRPRSRSRSTSTTATRGTSTTRGSRGRRRRPARSRAASASPRSRSASPEREARLEGTRCLHCWTNTIFEESPAEGTECILCGGCQDICPEDCIEILLSAARDAPSGGRARARAHSRRTARAEDRSSSRTRRPASAAASAPRAAPSGPSPCRASTRRRAPMSDESERRPRAPIRPEPSRRDFLTRIGGGRLRRRGRRLARRHPRFPEAEGPLRASDRLPRGQRASTIRRGRCASTASSAPT